MSINIERLPDLEDLDKDIKIIVGKNVVFKLYPKNSVYDSNIEIRKLIHLPGLCENSKFRKIQELVKLTQVERESLESLRRHKQRAVEFIKGKEKDYREFLMKMEKEHCLRYKTQLQDCGDEIKRICEQDLKLNLFTKRVLCFCSSCNSLIEEGEISAPLSCFLCENKVTRASNYYHNTLEPAVAKYLGGDWFSDYIARLFRSKNWKVWTNLHVLGSSGIPHEIDLLAIDKKGFIALGECKTGDIGRSDIFTFSTKCGDIANSFSFFFTMKEIPESETREFLLKNRFRFFEKINEKTEAQFIEEVFQETI